MKQGVMGASKTPRRKRHIASPVKLLHDAVIIRILPHDMMHPATTFAIKVFCARYDHGYSALWTNQLDSFWAREWNAFTEQVCKVEYAT